MHRRVFAAGLIGLSSTISALAQQSAPYLGRWSEEPAWCANNGHTDEKPIVITASAIEIAIALATEATRVAIRHRFG